MDYMKRSNSNTSISKHNPSAERILSYFDERREVFQGALKTAKSYFSIEGIHDLRLEIKRFRVLVKLIDCAAPSFASKPNLTIFKELFGTAGALRDIDICQAIVLPRLKTNDLSEYFNYLKQQELQHRIAFSDLASKSVLTAISRSRRQIVSELAVVSEENQQKRIRNKILKFVPKLNSLMDKKEPGNSDLHKVRKLAKSLRYSLDIWQECYGTTGSGNDATNQLKKTYRSLGDWHDFLLAHKSVDSFLSREAQDGMAESTAYTAFQKDLRQQAERFLSAYERDKRTLRKSLKRLVSDFS